MAPAPRSGCAINAAVELLGDPWAILVLRDIIFGNSRHFRELLVGSEEGIQVLPVMVALGNWGLAHRDGEHRLRVRAELLRDGGPDLVAAMMDELRELHLGVPRPDADAPQPSEQLRAAYKAAISDGASGHSAGTRP